MKAIIFSVIFSSITFISNAQFIGFPYSMKNEKMKADSSKYNYSCSAGTAFSYSPNIGNGNTFYVAPNFKWKFTPKLNVNAGVVLARDQYNLKFQNRTLLDRSVIMNSYQGGNSYNGIVYAKGDYTISNRITLTGSILTDFNSPMSNYGTQQNNSISNNLNLMSIGLDYKISDNVNIGASIQILNAKSPNFYNNMLYNNSLYNNTLYNNY